MRFEWEGIPLGELCLPGLRWILRNDSDLYLVYDDSEVDETGLPVRRRRELAIKASWRFFL